MDTLSRLRKEVDIAVKQTQKLAVDMYNLEEAAGIVDGLRMIAGPDSSLRVNTDRWTVPGFCVGYYLKEDEGFKSEKVAELLEYMLDSDYYIIREDDWEDGKWKEWSFGFEGSLYYVITVRIYYGLSDRCRQVKTGEVKEVIMETELVCD